MSAPGKPSQSEMFSESERAAMYAWAAEQGFAVRNAADESLVAKIWRRNRPKEGDGLTARGACSTCSDLLQAYRTSVLAYSKTTSAVTGVIGDDLKMMFERAEELRLACGHAHHMFMEHWRADHKKARHPQSA